MSDFLGVAFLGVSVLPSVAFLGMCAIFLVLLCVCDFLGVFSLLSVCVKFLYKQVNSFLNFYASSKKNV